MCVRACVCVSEEGPVTPTTRLSLTKGVEISPTSRQEDTVCLTGLDVHSYPASLESWLNVSTSALLPNLSKHLLGNCKSFLFLLYNCYKSFKKKAVISSLTFASPEVDFLNFKEVK